MSAPIMLKVHSAVLCIFPPNVKVPSSCIGVSKDEYNILFDEKEEFGGIIAISRHKQHAKCEDLRNIMSTVTQFEFDNQNKPTRAQNTLTLWCTRDFLIMNNLKQEDTVSVKRVKVYPLRKIVFGVPPENGIFQYTCSEKFTTNLLLSVCQSKLFAAKGQRIAIPENSLTLATTNVADSKKGLIDLVVLECEPLSHGIITVNTEIVLSKLKEEKKNSHPPIKGAPTAPVLVSDFTKYLSLDGEVVTLPNKGESRVDYLQLCCKVISDSSQLVSGKQLSDKDISNIVGLSKETVMKHGLFNDSLVSIAALRESSDLQSFNAVTESVKNNKRTKHERIARVQVIDCADNTAVMLPSLWFNLVRSWKGKKLVNDNSITVKKYEIFEEDGDDDKKFKPFSQSPSWKCQLPYATTVHVSLVQSPGYNQITSYGTILQKYFSIPRFVKKGDILSIPIFYDPELEGESGEFSPEKSTVVHFKISHVAPEVPVNLTFLVDSKHTDLFQEGNVKSYVPRSMSNIDGRDIPVCGLHNYITKLEEVIAPHLTKQSKRNTAPNREVPSLLLTGPAGCGKTSVCEALATRLHMHIVKANCYGMSGDTSASTEARLKAILQGAEGYAPCILVLDNIHSLGKDRDGVAEDPRVASAFHNIVRDVLDKSEWPVIIVATTSSPKLINSDLHTGFLHQFSIKVPDEETRQQMVRHLLQDVPCNSDVSVIYVAQRTAGFVLGDLIALCAEAKQMAFERAVRHCKTGKQPLTIEDEENIVSAGIPLVHADFQMALDKLQAAHSDAIGAPKIPDVKWDDIGGLTDIKAEILDTIQLPLQHPELLAAGLRRSGVLLFGPPGTGKTLLAKAVATECSLNFLSVKGPELINMYVGQSEENVREVFNRAGSATPCVIFFDELDSLAPNRGRTGDSGGVMDRVVSQLLAELDGLHKSCDVFVIGATNRPDLLDPALLRPGRFDKLLYLGVSEDKQSQLKIMKALTRKFRLADDCDLEKISQKCPMNLTGADFYALCSDAMLNAVKRKIDILEKGGQIERDSLQVSQQDFLQALSCLVPSVSEVELKHYAQIQHTLGAQG